MLSDSGYSVMGSHMPYLPTLRGTDIYLDPVYREETHGAHSDQKAPVRSSQVLKCTAGEINYGSQVTDNWAQRCIMSFLEDFYTPEVLTPEFAYSESGVYRQISTYSDLYGYLQYIKSLPLNDSPEIFGLHNNASITLAQNESFALLGTIVQLQPKTLMVGGRSSEEAGALMPSMFCQPVSGAGKSMDTVLVQEVIRYNKLLEAVAQTLKDLLKALKGLVVMSSQLQLVASSLRNYTVPERPEEKQRQSPSPPPSLGKGRPRRRRICLLVLDKNHPPMPVHGCGFCSLLAHFAKSGNATLGWHCHPCFHLLPWSPDKSGLGKSTLANSPFLIDMCRGCKLLKAEELFSSEEEASLLLTLTRNMTASENSQQRLLWMLLTQAQGRRVVE
ncbi:hypothetical protein AAES_81207 [Amazona aestiva]|uniref:Uncharacterized protein n=1 Tax=Amazona aestiva TaxID=12930 RepID=A0A0Q3USV2_AMAAE|nr:hypothetical protein AAES_81207 [Amazona aestiva]